MPGNPENIFANFAKMGGFEGEEDFSGIFGGGSPLGGGARFGSRFGGTRTSAGSTNGARQAQQPQREATVVEKPIAFTLEELFNGAKKKFKVKRKTFDRDGRIQREDKEIEIQVKPGMKAGSKFKFAGIGDEIDGTKQDIHFIVTEKPHPVFVRQGDDLIATISLPLKEALTGWSRKIQTIDGKTLEVSHSGPTPPNWSETYPGLGMVKPKDPSQRGNMIVKVDIVFPSYLSPEQKQKLKEILP